MAVGRPAALYVVPETGFWPEEAETVLTLPSSSGVHIMVFPYIGSLTILVWTLLSLTFILGPNRNPTKQASELIEINGLANGNCSTRVVVPTSEIKTTVHFPFSNSILNLVFRVSSRGVLPLVFIQPSIFPTCTR